MIHMVQCNIEVNATLERRPYSSTEEKRVRSNLLPFFLSLNGEGEKRGRVKEKLVLCIYILCTANYQTSFFASFMTKY